MKNFKNIKDIPKTIPVFPLNNCLLLPKGCLKLNIFDPRYLNMTNDAISDNRLIGMIQPGSNTKFYNVGCVGKIIHFTETAENKYLIELKGICRYNIISHKIVEKGYIQAEVKYTNFLQDLAIENINVNKKKFLGALKLYFTKQNINTDWTTIQKAPLDLLIRSIAQACPFNSEEKQMLLETHDINKLATNMISLFEINSAGETNKIN